MKIPTLFLKLTIGLLALLVLGLCIFVLPVGIATDNVGGYRPILIGMYVTVIPFYVALYSATKLLTYIDNGAAFSIKSVQALRTIRYSALLISILYTLGMPFIFNVADKDDAPGVVLIGCLFIGASLVIGTAAAVFESLVQSAVDIKSENDLTV